MEEIEREVELEEEAEEIEEEEGQLVKMSEGIEGEKTRNETSEFEETDVNEEKERDQDIETDDEGSAELLFSQAVLKL